MKCIRENRLLAKIASRTYGEIARLKSNTDAYPFFPSSTTSIALKRVKLWQLDSGTEICTLAGHLGKIAFLAIAPDGKESYIKESISAICPMAAA